MSKKHSNIPVFIPHLGCPQNCTFCNQFRISGGKYQDKRAVYETIRSALYTKKSENQSTQIAFFGGSFTAIPRDIMLSYLEVSDSFVEEGAVESVRISTRPDAVDEEICEILLSHHVKNVELGIQSMNDDVLRACRRGHTASDSEKAIKMLKKYGFSVGGQMMVGLPLSEPEDERNCAEFLVKMKVTDSRIYPLLVLKDTPLALDKEYVPLSTEEAVQRCGEVFDILTTGGVNVIRIGLQESEGLQDGSVIAGPHRPAIGEMAISYAYRKRADRLLEKADLSDKNELIFGVGPGKTSMAIGQKRQNIIYIKERYSVQKVRIIEKSDIIGYNIILL